MTFSRCLLTAVTGCAFAASPSRLPAQCSDAGVCVIGETRSRSGHSLGLSYSYGNSGKDTTLMFHTVRLEATYRLLEESELYVALPFSRQSGPAGSAGGIGDLTVLWNQTVLKGEGTLRLQGGVRLATGEVNAGGLAQAYQSSLGTNDVLFGATYEVEGIAAAAAYQFTTGRSANRVTRLKRGDDLMLRGGYTLRDEDMEIGGELLAIKRLQESSILKSTQPETFESVPASNQLQLNLVGRFAYHPAEQYVLHAETAVALLKRDSNVDGLKRAFTLSLGLTYLL